MAVAVFGDGHHRFWEPILVVLEQLLVGVETIKTILVGADPCPPMTVDEGADDAGGAYLVAFAQFISHIAELRPYAGLHVESFLQQAQPDVATAVFCDGINLGGGEVDVGVVERIVHQSAGLGIVDTQAIAIVTDEDVASVAEIELGDGPVARFIDMAELLAFAHVDAVVRGAHIHLA